MPAAIDPIIKQRVIAQYLQGVSRDTIAAEVLLDVIREHVYVYQYGLEGLGDKRLKRNDTQQSPVTNDKY
jgi:hypothetical protein